MELKQGVIKLINLMKIKLTVSLYKIALHSPIYFTKIDKLQSNY